MKTISIFAAFIFLFILSSSAQEENLVKSTNTRSQPNESIYVPLEEPLPIYNQVEGGGGYNTFFYYGDPTGMFLNADFIPGTASLKDGTEMEGAFRYNIYHQKIQAIVAGDTFAFAKPGELEWVQMGEQKFIYSSFMRNDYEVANTWFEVLCEGDCDLLLRRYIKYRVTDGDDDHSDDQLYKLEEYYVRKDEGAGKRMHATKKEVLMAIHEHKEEVARFIKSEKLKVKYQEDLVMLFEYYNSLE